MTARPVVLLVDDEPRILSALRRTLRREGWEVLAAETTHEALALVEDRPVDVVLSDQRMPGMSGLELLERVAARQPSAVRMLITGWTEAIAEAELRRVGVRAILNKPWDDGTLKDTLRSALEGREAPCGGLPAG